LSVEETQQFFMGWNWTTEAARALKSEKLYSSE
jgi:hypothetical protein